MKKKILALTVALAMLICAMPTAFAYNVRDAYEDFAAQYPGFIDNIVSQGVSESTILSFLRALQNYLYRSNRIEEITESNFDEALIDGVKNVSNASEFAELQNAMYRAYHDAAYEAYIYGRIHEDFMPLYEAVKSMVFEHDMLAERDTGEYEDEDIAITSIEPARDVEIEKDGSYTLDRTVDATTETGVSMELDVQWTNKPSTAKVGTFTAEGQAIIPSGYTLGSGVSAMVTAQVTVVEPQDDDHGNDNSGSSNNGNNGNSGNGNSGNGSQGSTGNNNVQLPEEEPVKHIYSFSDVDEKTELGKAVYALSDIGIINGYYDGTFQPDKTIRRDEFTKIMVLAMECTDDTAETSFTDVVKDQQWAYTFIASAEKVGLVNGKGDGTFGPELEIRRDEVMTVIYRALENRKALKSDPITIPTFSDDAKLAGWSRIPAYVLAQCGVADIATTDVGGVKFTYIDPLSNATRGQCAMMVYNALKMMGKVK